MGGHLGNKRWLVSNLSKSLCYQIEMWDLLRYFAQQSFCSFGAFSSFFLGWFPVGHYAGWSLWVKNSYPRFRFDTNFPSILQVKGGWTRHHLGLHTAHSNPHHHQKSENHLFFGLESHRFAVRIRKPLLHFQYLAGFFVDTLQVFQSNFCQNHTFFALSPI